MLGVSHLAGNAGYCCACYPLRFILLSVQSNTLSSTIETRWSAPPRHFVGHQDTASPALTHTFLALAFQSQAPRRCK
jgi:hypothetical protein